jgi:hypothetical protein
MTKISVNGSVGFIDFQLIKRLVESDDLAMGMNKLKESMILALTGAA